MKPKQIINIVLFAIIGVAITMGINNNKKASQSQDKPLEESGTVVYVFHDIKTCQTCKNMKTWAKNTLDENFDETITFKIINKELPENNNYVSLYDLTGLKLVAAQIENGKPTRHQIFKGAFDLAKSKTEPEFKTYMTEQLNSFIAKNN